MSIRIITDSAADLGEAFVSDHEVRIAPLRTIFPDGEYLQGVNLTAEQFYEKLIESTEVPRTSQATPYDFECLFEEAVAAGDDVVAIILSSKLSGTYNSAMTAAQSYEGRVFVVDSLSVTIGQQILVERAVQLREEGLNAAEIAQKLEIEKNQLVVIAALDTLEYLKKGGRVSSAVAIAGGILNIKPVIGIVDGAVELVGKARGSKQSNNLLRTKVFEAGGIDYSRPIRIGYTGLSDSILKKYLRDSADLYEGRIEGEIPVTHIGAVIGTHAGPGAVAVSFFRAE
ncbi:MAG: DegV family protein [Eggerthellaceae bacterium]|nr:DegV family protein [Eggerthellaceae bacterium]